MLQTSQPFSLILFGASGNLAKLKLYPALYTLALKKRLPKQYVILGFGRTVMTDEEFRAFVSESVLADMGEVTQKVLIEFLTHVHYRSGQYGNAEDMRRIGKDLSGLEEGWDSRVRIAYLSIPPQVMIPALRGLCDAGIHAEGKEFRCIVEKPVGHDLQSFEDIKKQLTLCLREEEIYLLDHYLGKEAMRNVYYLRFSNPVLERLFKHSLIRHVEITAAETVGVEGRAGYFEHTGTLRDMVQSHLIEVIALLTMHVKDSDEFLAASRKEAIQQLYFPHAPSLDDIVLQGQYEGYRKNQGVAPDSRTNTFIATKLMSRMATWQGVPFYLRTGKKLGKKETRISILFQEPRAVGKGSTPNRLDIILHGEAGMRLSLQTKLGGTEPAFRPLILTDPLVCIGDCLPEHGLLILEAIHGKKSWFLSFEEVHTAWRLIDTLQNYLQQPSTPLHEYAVGSDGPPEAESWIARDSASWFPLSPP